MILIFAPFRSILGSKAAICFENMIETFYLNSKQIIEKKKILCPKSRTSIMVIDEWFLTIPKELSHFHHTSSHSSLLPSIIVAPRHPFPPPPSFPTSHPSPHGQGPCGTGNPRFQRLPFFCCPTSNHPFVSSRTSCTSSADGIAGTEGSSSTRTSYPEGLSGGKCCPDFCSFVLFMSGFRFEPSSSTLDDGRSLECSWFFLCLGEGTGVSGYACPAILGAR